jgi:preprotein translocase subunit SecA
MRIKITVPNSLSEIKLSQYQKFLQIQKDNEDEHFLASKMIEIFCGIPHKESFSLKAKDVHRITNILADMFEQKPQLKRRFVLNGVEYGFIPNLDDMTLGEYVDLDTYISKWEEVEKAMAVLYRPIANTYKDKYNIEEYKAEGSEVFKDLPMDIVFGSMLFFYRLGIDLSRVMTSYLESKGEIPQQQMHNLVLNGDGISQFSHSLREILRDLSISLN